MFLIREKVVFKGEWDAETLEDRAIRDTDSDDSILVSDGCHATKATAAWLRWAR